MEVWVETLNRWGEWHASASMSMLLQSAILIVILSAMDFALRHRTRAVVRHMLWLLLLAKLALPVNFSLPTGILQLPPPPPSNVQASAVNVSALPNETIHHIASAPEIPSSPPVAVTPSFAHLAPISVPLNADAVPVRLTLKAAWLLFWATGCLILIGVISSKAMRLRSALRRTRPASAELQELLRETGAGMGVKRALRLRVSEENAGPALCGLIRPCVLIPKSVTTSLSLAQLRTVFLHEIAHLKRNDLPLNLVQTALQVLYFYNPLLWLANARIRTLREEAVDEAVLVATAAEPETYPTALLNVARLTRSSSPLAFQGVGIIESRSSLGARIQRMVALPIPRSARVGVVWTVAFAALGACLLPMATPAQNEPANPAPMVSAADARRFLDKVPLADPRFLVDLQAITNRLVNSADVLLPVLLEAISKPLGEDAPADRRRERARDYWILSIMGRKAAPAVPHLISALEAGGDEAYRGPNYITPQPLAYAADALGALGAAASNAVPALVDSAHFGNAKALTALARIAPANPEVENLVLSKWKDRGAKGNIYWLRLEAISALSLLAPASAKARSAIAHALEDEDELIRSAAVQIVMSEAFPGSKALLTEALAGDLKSRVRAASLLAPYRRNDEKIYNTLVEGLASAETRPQALRGLVVHPDRSVNLLPQLLAFLKDEDHSTRLASLRVIANLPAQKSPELVAAILPLEDGSDSEVAATASRAIRTNKLLTPEVVTKLKADVRSSDRWRKTRALQQISALNCLECTAEVVEAFHVDDWARAAAISTLGNFPEAAIPLIPKLIELYEGGQEIEGVASTLGRWGRMRLGRFRQCACGLPQTMSLIHVAT